MKRTYVKPELLVERFALTQTLSNCSVLIGFHDQKCVLGDVDSTAGMKMIAVRGYFAPDACERMVTDADATDGMCYHISVNMVFSS